LVVGIFFGRCGADDQIDLGHLEASDRHIDVGKGDEMLKLDLQHLFIPAGVLCKPVIRNNIGPNLIWSQVFEADGRHLCHPEKLCRLHSSVACNDRSGSINQDGINEAESLNTIPQFPNLRLSVSPGVTPIWS
jgi:hypothetical protein